MQIIFGSYNGSTGIDNFCPIGFGNICTATSEAQGSMPCPAAGTFNNLRIKLSVAPGGGTGFRNFFLRVNGVDSALTCQFVNAATDVRDTTHSVTVARGDIISLHDHSGNFPAGTQVYFTIEFTSTSPGQSIYGGNDSSSSVGDGATNSVFGPHTWRGVSGYQQLPGTSDVVSIAGRLTGLNHTLSAAPGTGKSITFTVFKNGSPTSASVTIADTATSGSWTGSLNLAVGDLVYQQITYAGGPSGSITAWGAQFTATIGNQWMIGSSNISVPSNTAVRYIQPNNGDGNGGAAYSATETFDVTLIGPVSSATLIGLIVVVSGAPGGSWQIATRQNGATPASAPIVTISGGATTGSDTNHNLALVDTDVWTWQSTPTGTPNASNVSMAWAWAGKSGALPPPPSFVLLPPVPLAPQAPCAPQAQVSGGGKGKSGCNPGGVGRVSSYPGPFGAVPAHADPVDGELLTGKTNIDVWMDLIHTDYPSGTQTTYRRSLVELGDLSTYEGGRKPAGLLSVGSVDHGLSNEQGGFAAANTTIKFGDETDRFIRNLADSQDLEYDEVRIKLASPPARLAGSAPRVPCRGVVQTPVLDSPLEADLTVVDSLFAEFGPSGPGRNWPALVPPLVGFSTPADVLATPIPWLYGEKSDEGATDPTTGAVVSKGLCPLYWLGQEKLTRTVILTTPPVGSTSAGIPPVMDVGQTGAPGTIMTKLHSYVTCVSGGVEGPLGAEGSNLDRGDFGDPHGIRVNWGQVPGVDSYRIYIFGSSVNDDAAVGFNPLSGDGLNGGTCRVFTHDNVTFDGFQAIPGQDFYVAIHDWTDGAPYTGALTPVPSLATATAVTITEDWDAYLVVGHPIFRIISVYGSDLGGGDPAVSHDRTKLDPNTRADILVPGFAAWPFTPTYRAYTGADGKTYWFTVIYARGPLSDDHKNGVVTMAVNAIGVEDVGDGTGLPLVDAHACQQHWLENPILGNWTSGVWATNVTYPQWEDGTAKVRSSSFATRQAFTAGALPPRGLTIDWYVDTTQGLGAWYKLWNRSTESRLGVNGHGQIVIWGLDETVDPTNWPSLDHVVDIFGKVQSISGQERENVVSGSFDWDPDASRFRAPAVTYQSPAGIQKYKGHTKQGEALDTTMLSNPTQFAWVLQRRLTRLQFGAKQVQIDGPIGYLDRDVGTGILLTTIEGTGAVGYSQRPFIILWRSLNIATRIVTYTLLDVNALLIATAFTNGLTRLFTITDVGANEPVITDTANAEPLIRV